jgi:hypothetical protein
VLLAGCAGGGSSASSAAAAIPAGLPPASGQVSPRGSRRTLSAPACSGVGTYSFIGGGNGDVAAGYYTAALGGYKNEVCDEYSLIADGEYNTISSGADSASASFIAGGLYNTITGSAYDAAIVGGASNTISGSGSESSIGGGSYNSISAAQAAIGGGGGNAIASGAGNSFIGGGDSNTLSGQYGFIGAGTNNAVSGEGGYIAAGGYNSVTGEGAVIDGGFNSTAAGAFATIPGGYVDSAAGTYSFAAGARASAPYTGDFVWSDGSDGDTILTSTATYQFLARASGGFTLYTNAASTVGAQLAAGSGTWASLSDRNVKTNIAPLDDATVLAKVAQLPISRWSYKSEHGVRHVGPMAQDFYAAFGVGEDDKHITSIDEDGVALAAIKALHTENADLRAQVRRERQERRTITYSQSVEIAALRSELESIRAEIRAKR